MEDKQVQVNLRLPLSLKVAAEMAARQDHRSLTSLIEKLLAEHVRIQPGLEEWHERAMARLLGIIADNQLKDHIKGGFLARSYLFSTRNNESLSPHSLVNTLSRTHDSLNNIFESPRFVYPFTRQECTPYFTADNKLSRGRTAEILESAALPEIVRLEFWRVSPAGLVTDIRPYEEDDDERWSHMDSLPGKWFSPFFLTRQLAAMVLHASFFSEKFSSAETVEFRCEWRGLRERTIADPDRRTSLGYGRGKMARADHRVTIGEWPVFELKKSWADIVSTLGGPVMRMFDEQFDYSASFVSAQMDRVIKR